MWVAQLQQPDRFLVMGRVQLHHLQVQA
jgi:hypothetical protein